MIFKAKEKVRTIQMVLLIALLSFVVMTCKPDEEPVIVDCTECGPYKLGEIADYLYFKPGSWWVYKESFSGELDTIRMTRSQREMRKVIGEKRTITYETLSYTKKSNRHDAIYSYWQTTPFPDGYKPYSYRFKLVKSHSEGRGGFIGQTQPFALPAKNGENVGGGSGNTTRLIRRMDSLQMQGLVYYDVILFETTDDATFIWGKDYWNDGGPTSYYWAKGIGLIKNNSLKLNKNWELIESYLEP